MPCYSKLDDFPFMSFWENWVSLFHITELLIYLLSVSISSSSSIYLSIHHLPIYHLSVIYHWSIICFSEDKMPIIPSVTNPFSHLLLSHSHSVPHFFSTFFKKNHLNLPQPQLWLAFTLEVYNISSTRSHHSHYDRPCILKCLAWDPEPWDKRECGWEHRYRGARSTQHWVIWEAVSEG